MKRILTTVAAGALAFTTLSAAAANYDLVRQTTSKPAGGGWNQNDASADASEVMGGVAGGDTLSGNIYFHNDGYDGQGGGMIDYSADLSIDLIGNTVSANNVSCTGNTHPDECGFFLGEGESTSFSYNATGNGFVLAMAGGDSWNPRAYELEFQVSEVPVPAAAWLFGSALLMLRLRSR